MVGTCGSPAIVMIGRGGKVTAVLQIIPLKPLGFVVKTFNAPSSLGQRTRESEMELAGGPVAGVSELIGVPFVVE